MRTLHLIISIFLYSNLLGQTSKNYAVFKTEDFTNIKLKNSTKTEKISYDGSLDLHFYRKHFFIPYYFPDKLIDTSYKSEIVIIWRDTTEKRDYKSNWTHTFKYDEKSRVTDYAFSGCFICSNLPYTIKLFYNNLDEVIKMEKYYSLEIPTGDSLTNRKLSILKPPVETFIFNYDNNREIIRLDYFINEVLSKRISKT